MALTDKLSAIGNAIRAKTGGTELLTLDAMPTEIASITTGGGGLPEEALNITGNCQYRLSYNGWNWLINEYGNQITTKDITSLRYMFADSSALENIPFTINCYDYRDYVISSMTNDTTYMFSNCQNLKELPKIINPTIINTQGMFEGCHRLRYIPDDYCDTWSRHFLDVAPSYTGNASSMITNCYSLRNYPAELFNYVNRATTSVYSSCYYRMCYYCYSMDEIIDIPVPYTTNAFTSNLFMDTFTDCTRAKRVTFAIQENGTPYTVKWKSQTMDFTKYVGWIASQYDGRYITSYNSGITEATMVTDDTSYQALKNNPDWWTFNPAYSRYNHDSAVETINSLPDASEYLASAGGTNTIKFKGSAGSLTDGGAINTLTEEEIAVATAKGWTVALA